MAPLPKEYVNDLVAHLVAWYHETRRPVPKGLAPYSGYVGVVKRRMIRVWQEAHHLPVTGMFDTATQQHLIPPDPRQAKASKVVAYCEWGIQHRLMFHYDQFRPVSNPPPAFLYKLPRRRDCSGFAEDAEYIGFGKSVNGYAFNSGYGNTDSMLRALPSRPIFALRQADLIVFSNPGHVVIVTGTHATNPRGVLWLTGDGREGAPDTTTLQQQLDSHPGTYTGLSVD